MKTKRNYSELYLLITLGVVALLTITNLMARYRKPWPIWMTLALIAIVPIKAYFDECKTGEEFGDKTFFKRVIAYACVVAGVAFTVAMVTGFITPAFAGCLIDMTVKSMLAVALVTAVVSAVTCRN